MEELIKNISFILLFVILLPLFVAVFRRKMLTRVQRRLAYLVLLVAAFEMTSYLFWYNAVNNHPLYHFYSVFEFWLVLNIYQISLGKWLTSKVILLLGTAFTFFAIGNVIFLQDLTEFNSNVTTTSGIIIIFLSLVSFFQLLTKRSHSSVFSDPQFYINSGFLIYFSSNLVLFFISSRVTLSLEESYLIWGIHSIINCILIIFYTIALWIRPKEG